MEISIEPRSLSTASFKSFNKSNSFFLNFDVQDILSCWEGYEYSLLSSITARDFYNVLEHKQSKRIERIIKQYDIMEHWIQSEILNENLTYKERKKIYEKVINLGKKAL